MFATPVPAGRPDPGLDFVKDQENVMLITEAPQSAQPFPSEMIISAFALNRLDDQASDVECFVLENLSDLAFGARFFLPNVFGAGRFRKRKVKARSRNS